MPVEMQFDKSMVTEPKSGFILHSQRLSTEDGPGIRSTIFFKGCPLQCQWCHNPESLSTLPQVQWLEHQCIACGTCVDICPNNCIVMMDQGIVIDWEQCVGCGSCAHECPTNAMELLGTRVSVGELFDELVKDRAYYESSGGGITVSGGEPLLQPDFVAALMQRFQAVGIQTALDTCGFCSVTALEKVLPFTDLLMFDLKEIDPARHHAFTGQSNQRILENILLVRDWLLQESSEKRFWIRTPLIPGATATQQNLEGIGAFIAANLDGLVQRWELCAFNNLCRDKYRRLGLLWPYADTPLMTRKELSTLEQWARRSGVDPEIVVATGAMRESDT